MAEFPNWKNGREGKSKEGAHKCNAHNVRNNRWLPGVVHMCDDNKIFPPSKKATMVSDLVMADVTPQEKKPVNFEEQLREIDDAINADVTLQELTGIKELKKDNRVGIGFSNIDQPEVLGAGVKEKAVRTQIQRPGSIDDSARPYGLAKEQNEA